MLQSKQPMKLQSSLSTKWIQKPTREKQAYNAISKRFISEGDAPQKRTASQKKLREAKRSNWS